MHGKKGSFQEIVLSNNTFLMEMVFGEGFCCITLVTLTCLFTLATLTCFLFSYYDNINLFSHYDKTDLFSYQGNTDLCSHYCNTDLCSHYSNTDLTVTSQTCFLPPVTLTCHVFLPGHQTCVFTMATLFFHPDNTGLCSHPGNTVFSPWQH